MTKRQLKEIAKEAVLASRIDVLSRAQTKAIEYDLSSDDKDYVLGMVSIYLDHLRQYMRR